MQSPNPRAPLSYNPAPRLHGMPRAIMTFAIALSFVAFHARTAAAQRGGGAGQAAPAGRTPTIDERTSGMQKLDGYFPLYWDERAGTLWLEIPRFDTQVLYATGLSAGLGSNDIGLDR